MRVTIVDREAIKRDWGQGFNGVMAHYLVTVDIADTCPTCGQPRGEPRLTRQCEDGDWYSVHQWSNPCGHIDLYRKVLTEAREGLKDAR